MANKRQCEHERKVSDQREGFVLYAAVICSVGSGSTSFATDAVRRLCNLCPDHNEDSTNVISLRCSLFARSCMCKLFWTKFRLLQHVDEQTEHSNSFGL